MWDFLKKSLRFIYSLYAFLVFFITGFVTLIYYILISPLPNNTRLRWVYAYNRIWFKTWGYLTGFIFDIRGESYINRKETYVLMANHVNILDIFTTASHIRLPFMPLAKKEVYKVPILGQLVGLNAIPVDRSSPESRKESMKRMVEKMMTGTSILIFPEGTRNRTGQPLKNFYDGGFRLAIEAQKPIIPILLLNTRTLQPVNSVFLQPGRIRMDFLEPIDTQGMSLDDLPALKARIRKLMYEHIVKEDKSFKDFSPSEQE
ncbi:MAG: lysophospholipid acyltransferase family protein [Bacteroidota bacterium]